MSFEYNKLVQKVDTYLRSKREKSRLWRILLPEQLFTPALWLWEARSVAIGAAWGTSWAIAPVPMQTVFAVLCSMRTRGNIPMSVLGCCISFPGYQIILWPLQWYAGAVMLNSIGLGSGIGIDLITQAAEATMQGWQETLAILSQVKLLTVCVELLLGCLVTCALLWVLTYSLIVLLWRRS